MLNSLLEGLTSEQKRQLEDLKIPHSRRSDWKHGRRLPTAAQCMVLAMVTDSDPLPLLAWLAEQEASPAQRAMFSAVKAGRSLKAAVALAVSLSAGASQAFGLYPSDIPAGRTYSNARHIVAIAV
jgi:hypothetical protein